MGLDPDLPLTQLVHTAWQVEDGLPQNTVKAVTQTQDGYLWMGTQAGLVRFDGVSFRAYDRSNTPGLGSDHIVTLLETRNGDLWIGTDGGGLTRKRGQQFKTFTTEHGLSSDVVWALHEDRDGRLWVGTLGGGLNRLEDETFTPITTEDGLPGDDVLAIREDAAGDLWVGTQAGLIRLHDGRIQRDAGSPYFAGTIVSVLRTTKRGDLWAGTYGKGLCRRSGVAFDCLTAGDGLTNEVVSALFEDDSGALWAGTLGGGLFRYYQGRFASLTTREGLTDDLVRALFQDAEGSLWIGTDGGGLNRLRGSKFINYTTREGLSNDVVLSVLEGREGSIWIGTEGGGLNRLKDGRITHFTNRHGLMSDYIYALHEDREGTLWAGLLDGGVCRLEDERFTCWTEREGLSSNNVYSMYEDEAGALWIGTDAGLNRIRNGRVEPLPANASLPEILIRAILEDRQGRLWIGTYGNGVIRFQNRTEDGSATATEYTSQHGLSSLMIVALHQDAEGTIWAGTVGGGLCRFESERFRCFGTRDGLPSDDILQILEDDSGFLWLGTMKGISRISFRDLDAYAEGQARALQPAAFREDDGLKSPEMNGGTQPAAWKARDGRLWFSTMAGLAMIDPAHIRINNLPPPVHIESFTVNGRALDLGAPMILPPGQKSFAFAYTGLSYVAPGQVKFRYKLEGYDEEWVQAGARRETNYTSLPPGSYRFVVQASNDDGVWSEAGASLAFHLRPFFYQTPLFWVLSALALALAAFSGYALRIRQLKARQAELERTVDERTRDLQEAKDKIEVQANSLRELDRFKTNFFANISHEFRIPLTLIVGPLENALHGAQGSVPGALRDQMQVMLRNARRLLRLINQLLDLSKLESAKMSLRAQDRNIISFLESIIHSFTALAEQKGITLSFTSDCNEARLYYEPDKLEKVFFNLLSNAMKFTPAGGAIRVCVVERTADDAPEGVLEVRVNDTGRGIPPEHLPYVFDRFHQVDGSNTREYEGTGIGLALVRELVLLHGGTVTVESEVGRGTEFVVTLRKGQGHLRREDVAEGEGEDADAEPGQGTMLELAAVASDNLPVEHATTASGAPAPEGAPLILIVDDNPDIRAYVAFALRTRFRTAEARDGEEGLEQARALRPELIISDIMMPKMDGNELCSRLKSEAALCHIPIILLSAKTSQNSIVEGLEHGADEYMAKPFNERELLARVNNLLKLREQERELKSLNANLEQRVREQLEMILSERRTYEKNLLAEKDRAKEAARLKGAILRNMSHEFRTPITSIIGSAEILADEVHPPFQEFAEFILSGGRRLMRTLDNVLELSCLEAGILQPDCAPVPVQDVIEQALGEFKGIAEEKGLDLRYEAVDESAVCMDCLSFSRVLSILLDNATKFTERGAVVVQARRTDASLLVSIRDTGIGIDSSFLPRLFDAFQQESDSDARRFEGAGLSLSIARRLVELMGGTITVESEKGAGSTFTVLLPLAPSPEAFIVVQDVVQQEAPAFIAGVPESRRLRDPDDRRANGDSGLLRRTERTKPVYHCE